MYGYALLHLKPPTKHRVALQVLFFSSFLLLPPPDYSSSHTRVIQHSTAPLNQSALMYGYALLHLKPPKKHLVALQVPFYFRVLFYDARL